MNILRAKTSTPKPLKIENTGDLDLSPSKDEVTIILPTLNEEDSIGEVIDELRSNGYNEIFTVEGYSTDRTLEIAKEKGVKVIFQHGKGKGGAVKTAIDYVETPYMLVMDADYTYDPKDIERMLNHISDYDEVIGMRIDREHIPRLHRFGNRILASVFSLLTGQRLNDPCSGMYLLRTERAKNLELTATGFEVEMEIAAQVAAFGRLTETPVSYRKRLGNTKLNTWRAGFRILINAAKMGWLYNPIFVFSTMAAFFTFPGAAILLWQLLNRYIYNNGNWSEGWSWIGLILIIGGLQGFTISTISLLLKRMERRIVQARRKD